MTAIWMMYALATGTILAALAWLLEQLARSFGRPTRGIWIGAIGAMLAVGLVAANPTVVATRRAKIANDANTVGGYWAGLRATVDQLTPPPVLLADKRGDARDWWSRIAAELDARAARAIERAAPWDRALLVAWALATAFLAGVLVHAATVGKRLRTGLDAHEIDGTPVLLSDEIGPAAVGVRRKAILLPRWALALEPALLRLIVRHEREHLEQSDPAVLLVALLAVVLVPWNLPLWWAWRRLSLAVEVDCDARVLRADPDVRRYGQLLLLASQRAVRTPLASAPVFAVVAPLRPQHSRVAQRILVMTRRGSSVARLRTVLFALGSIFAAATAFALPAPRPHQASRAIVYLTSLGLRDTPADPILGGLQGEILLYADGDVRAATGIDTLVPMTDTLHLKRLPAITADVTDGELHIVLIGPGTFSVGGGVVGGTASGAYFRASGRHVVLMKGGIGIRGER